MSRVQWQAESYLAPTGGMILNIALLYKEAFTCCNGMVHLKNKLFQNFSHAPPKMPLCLGFVENFGLAYRWLREKTHPFFFQDFNLLDMLTLFEHVALLLNPDGQRGKRISQRVAEVRVSVYQLSNEM